MQNYGEIPPHPLQKVGGILKNMGGTNIKRKVFFNIDFICMNVQQNCSADKILIVNENIYFTPTRVAPSIF